MPVPIMSTDRVVWYSRYSPERRRAETTPTKNRSRAERNPGARSSVIERRISRRPEKLDSGERIGQNDVAVFRPFAGIIPFNWH